MTKILVINPGSTSTRLALFEDNTKLVDSYIECSSDDIAKCNSLLEQLSFRKKQVFDFLTNNNIALSDLTAVVARGAPLRPLTGGVYIINDAMLNDATSDNFTDHISKIACIIANKIAQKANIPCFTADHISTDEYDDISRITGLPEIKRKSLTHALNMKAVARIFAQNLNKKYEDLNLITAHLGGGLSIAVHQNGRMIDSVDANGEASFSPERAGGFRSDDFAKWVLNSGKSFLEIRKILTRTAGLFAHLGTKDAREVETMINNGNKNAKLVYEALAYNIAKNICALSAGVCGKVDGIILTGGLANSKMLTQMIVSRVSFLASVTIMAGEKEMEALNDGALRVLSGKELPRIYPSGDFYEKL